MLSYKKEVSTDHDRECCNGEKKLDLDNKLTQIMTDTYTEMRTEPAMLTYIKQEPCIEDISTVISASNDSFIGEMDAHNLSEQVHVECNDAVNDTKETVVQDAVGNQSEIKAVSMINNILGLSSVFPCNTEGYERKHVAHQPRTVRCSEKYQTDCFPSSSVKEESTSDTDISKGAIDILQNKIRKTFKNNTEYLYKGKTAQHNKFRELRVVLTRIDYVKAQTSLHPPNGLSDTLECSNSINNSTDISLIMECENVKTEDSTLDLQYALEINQNTEIREKLYRCETCRKAFAVLGDLQLHMVSHETHKVHECAICHKEFAAYGSLCEHKTMPLGGNEYQSGICIKKCVETSSYGEPLNKVHVPCEKCESTETDHLKTHAIEKEYGCGNSDNNLAELSDLCKSTKIDTTVHSVKSTEAGDLKVHAAEREYRFKNSDENFAVISALCEPGKMDSAKDAYKTSEVEYPKTHALYKNDQFGNFEKFAESPELCKTKKMHTGNKPSISSETEHVKIHATGHEYPCGNSDKSFLEPSDLCKPGKKQAVNNPIKSSEIEQVKIHPSKALLVDSGLLRSHKKASTLTERKPFVGCGICEKKFADYSNLEIHINKHMNDLSKLRAIKCTVCRKIFHVGLAQSEIKPFKCVTCLQQSADCMDIVPSNTLGANVTTQSKNMSLRSSCSRKDNLVCSKPKQETHTEEKPFGCQMCGKRFLQYHSLKSHRMTVHSGVPLADSVLQGRVTTTTITRRCPVETDASQISGKQIQATVKAVECAVCQKKFIHIGHMHTEIKTYKCVTCFQQSANGRDISPSDTLGTNVTAQSENTIKRFAVSTCGRKDSLKYIKPNQKTHTREKPFRCKTCAKRFARNESLRLHMMIVHSGMKPYQCKICGKRLKSHLASHMRTHTGVKPFECKICRKRFSKSGNRDAHMRVHTKENPFECKICGKRFRNSYSLPPHQRVHTGEKPFTCETCGRRFAQRGGLKTHMILVHLGLKPVKCKICGKGLSGHLNNHMKIHTVKPFECKLCSRRVLDGESHMRIHTGVRPFKCGVCAHTYTQPEYLRKHIRRQHTSYEPSQCQASEREFDAS